MAVRLTNCFEDLCANPTGFTGFALIRLVNQAEGMLVDTSVDPCRYIPCDIVYRADIDPNTGCWVSCALPCNDDLSPSGSYYEIQEFVNGKCCGSHLVQLDCASNVYPDPTPICDVSITNPGPPPSPLLCPVVKSCETPFVGVEANGIVITAGDNPAGNPGNGHQPTIGVLLSTDAGNDITFGSDGGLFIDVPSAFACAALATCSINALADVDTTTTVPALNDVLTWTGALWEPRPIPAPPVTVVTGGSTNCASTAVTGSGTLGDPFVVSVTPTISVDPDNALSCTPGGLFVEEVALQAADTNEINLTLAGAGANASPWVISANLNIDPTSEAPVSVTPFGVKIDCCPIAAEYDFGSPAPVHGASVPGAGTPSSPLQFPVPALQVLDSDCIDLTLTGTGVQADPWIIGASPVINPAVDNILTCDGNGLYVPAPAVVDHPDVVFSVNSSVSGVTQSGPDNHVVDITTLSSDAGNLLSVGSDGGLFIDCTDVSTCVPGMSVVAGDTDCIDVTVTGAGTVGNPYVISAEPNIDSGADNVLECRPGGLFSPLYLVTQGEGILLTGVGSSVDPWVVNIDASTRDCIIGTGTASDPIRLLVDPDITNALVCTSDGVYVPAAVAPDGSETIVTGSPCIDVTGSGTLADPYVVDVNLDADPNNQLTCGPDGLLVVPADGSETVINAGSNVTVTGTGTLVDPYIISALDGNGLQVADSDCIDLTLTGTGSEIDPWIISANPIISTDPGNAIECRVNGLFAVPDVDIVGLDTSCIDLTVVEAPAGTFTISANPVIDPNLANILTCGPTGLMVTETVVSVVDNGDGTVSITVEDGSTVMLDVCQLLTDAVAAGCPVFPGRDSVVDSDSFPVDVATPVNAHPVTPLSVTAGTLVGAWVTVDAPTTTAPFSVNVIMNGLTVATAVISAGSTSATPVFVPIGVAMPALSTGTFTLVGDGGAGEFADDFVVTYDWRS